MQMRDSPEQAMVAPDPSALTPDPDRRGRFGLWVVLLGMLGFAVWAGLAPLDEGVPTAAMVTLDTKRKAVQHQHGGLIREVMVREGDLVQEGQALLRLDDAVAKANLESVRQRYLALRAMEARLMAEQAGQEHIAFGSEVKAAGADPQIARHLQTQQQIFLTRRLALKADLKAIDESIRGQEAAIQAYAGMAESREMQRRLTQEQLLNMTALVKDGYAPRNMQLEIQRQLAETEATITELQGNAARARLTIAELQQRAVSRQQDYRRETDLQMAEVAREVQSDESKYRALSEEFGRSVIRSPATGQVVGLAFQSVGSVVAAGEKLMDIVPDKELLLLEARIPPHLIDSIRPGLKTDVRFSTFAHAPQMVVEGEIKSISADVLTENTPHGQIPYFLARVELTPQGIRDLGRHRVLPGMPAEVIIKTGERTTIAYLLHPLTRRIAASMKEQ